MGTSYFGRVPHGGSARDEMILAKERRRGFISPFVWERGLGVRPKRCMGPSGERRGPFLARKNGKKSLYGGPSFSEGKSSVKRVMSDQLGYEITNGQAGGGGGDDRTSGMERQRGKGKCIYIVPVP